MEIGELDLTFTAGEVRELSAGGVELVQRIFPTIRDTSWSTRTPAVLHEAVTRTDGAGVTYAADLRYEVDGSALAVAVECTVVGGQRPTVRYRFTGTFDGAVDYNRIGLAVLHPLRQAGAALRWHGARLLSAAGSGGTGRLPRLIAPQVVVDDRPSPFLGPYRHLEIGEPERTVVLEFDGDDFEMEDQRNWSDASYKTYCTPLALRGPHRAAPGTQVRQEVMVTVVPSGMPPTDAPVEAPAPRHYMRVGVVVDAAAAPPATDAGLDLAVDLGFDTLVIDTVEPGEPAVAALTRAARQRRLEPVVRVLGDAPAPRTPLANGVRWHAVPEGRVPQLVDLQLMDLTGRADVWFTISPFVHANDAWSLSRAPESLPAMVATASRLAPEARIWLGPLLFDTHEATHRFPPPPGSSTRPRPADHAVDAWFARIVSLARSTPLAGIAPLHLAELHNLRWRREMAAALTPRNDR